MRDSLQALPWKKSHTDRMLDLYFSGAQPERIASVLQRSPKEISRILCQFIQNERERITRYLPFRRASRIGKKITENEKQLIGSHKRFKVPLKYTARLLMRKLHEIEGEDENKPAIKLMSADLTPNVDLLIALRYVYYTYQTQIISDKTWNDLKQEELEYGGGGPILTEMEDKHLVKPWIKSLALYLVDKFKNEGKAKDLKKR